MVGEPGGRFRALRCATQMNVLFFLCRPMVPSSLLLARTRSRTEAKVEVAGKSTQLERSERPDLLQLVARRPRPAQGPLLFDSRHGEQHGRSPTVRLRVVCAKVRPLTAHLALSAYRQDPTSPSILQPTSTAYAPSSHLHPRDPAYGVAARRRSVVLEVPSAQDSRCVAVSSGCVLQLWLSRPALQLTFGWFWSIRTRLRSLCTRSLIWLTPFGPESYQLKERINNFFALIVQQPALGRIIKALHLDLFDETVDVRSPLQPVWLPRLRDIFPLRHPSFHNVTGVCLDSPPMVPTWSASGGHALRTLKCDSYGIDTEVVRTS